MDHKLVSVVTPCFNEEQNILELYERIRSVFLALPNYSYEHWFIDNKSTDSTRMILRDLSQKDKNIRVIFNARNFGHIRSPFHGTIQPEGEAVILLASDLQDPPEIIPDLLKKWEEGNKVVMMVKEQSEESPVFFAVRKLYYYLITKISEVKLVKNYTGSGLYDKVVIRTLRNIQDPYPYFRGLIPGLGYQSSHILFKQPLRKRGLSSNNFYSLFDMAMLGITNHSKVPLRIATFTGLILALLSFLVGLGYLLAKLAYWHSFSFGLAPLLVGFFFISAVQLIFIGLLGEYLGVILTQVQKRPLVIEEERINC